MNYEYLLLRTPGVNLIFEFSLRTNPDPTPQSFKKEEEKIKEQNALARIILYAYAACKKV